MMMTIARLASQQTLPAKSKRSAKIFCVSPWYEVVRYNIQANIIHAKAGRSDEGACASMDNGGRCSTMKFAI